MKRKYKIIPAAPGTLILFHDRAESIKSVEELRTAARYVIAWAIEGESPEGNELWPMPILDTGLSKDDGFWVLRPDGVVQDSSESFPSQEIFVKYCIAVAEAGGVLAYFEQENSRAAEQ